MELGRWRRPKIGAPLETEGTVTALPNPHSVIIKQGCDSPDFSKAPVFKYITEAPTYSTGLPELLAKRRVTDTGASVLSSIKHSDIPEGTEACTFEPVAGVIVALGKELGCWKVQSVTIDGLVFNWKQGQCRELLFVSEDEQRPLESARVGEPKHQSGVVSSFETSRTNEIRP